ncbi:zinc-dependent peptidase [Halocynthiibacter namhaensis]|uniref:M90 family metallopeptidase n=1 Tax=Halocynthiibacter namhaensis TaxID=1290553 RepID=UPI000A9443E5|nr:M90 family metallopeptidase [Halocynthiibacter namhaensis]
MTEREIIRAGESWTRGPVVLSWAHSKQGALNTTDGHNVILHEFAHQMDDLTGGTNGVPILAKGQSFTQWEGAILPAYETHLRDVESGRKTVMDAYGAQGHEEFFAVGVETFFEKPKAMKQDMPEVYAQFKNCSNSTHWIGHSEPDRVYRRS